MRCNPNLLTLGYEASFLCPVIPHGNSDAKKKKLASFLVFLKDLALQSSGTSRLASVGTPFWMIALFDWNATTQFVSWAFSPSIYPPRQSINPTIS
jgi:hypothetical protein